MRRYLKYIFITLLCSLLAVSCLEEIDSPQAGIDSDALTLVPRVTGFANQYVTKAAYVGNEGKITSLAVLVFNNNGDLVHMQEIANANSSTKVSLNKSMFGSKVTVVMIANVGLDKIKDADEKSLMSQIQNLPLGNIEDYSCYFDENTTVITDISGTDFKGFPMMGRTEVELANKTSIAVNLEILYAKVNFNISVAEGTENVGTDMSFTMNGYSVHNVSKVTSLTPPEGATESDDYAYTTAGKTVTYDSPISTALNGTALTFTFYVAESRYALASGQNLSGIYPDDTWANALSQYTHLRQQYKPKIVAQKEGRPGNGLATYVLLNGVYKDYRGQDWDVNYKVYLGKDNHSNFEVDRNSQYTNYITLKGIRNNDSYTGDQQVWVDHRVDVTSTVDNAFNVSITRETLIDSHIEVRPLRVHLDEGVTARIYLPTDNNGNLISWIGIERFTGDNCQDITLYCHHGSVSTGKRRYFTTDLISELQTKSGEDGVLTDGNGKKYIQLQDGDCAWIYFDENTPTGSDTTSGDRSAVINISFYSDDVYSSTESYEITQRGIKAVGGYNIESYEEYLHSYDSADKYNLSTSPTDYTQQGFVWGLSGMKLSSDYIVSAAPINDYDIPLLGNVDLKTYINDWRYDYFHKSDAPSGNTYYNYNKVNGSWITSTTGSGTGLTFTDRASAKGLVTVKDMGSVPENAYQYCLSKNKFEADADGNVNMTIHWYLPDVHELQSVLGSTASDLSSDAYYWSSQPSSGGINASNLPLVGQYLGNIALLDEDVSNARAVSKAGKTDHARSAKNRIRCIYSKTGKEIADMSERIPDGVGGNFIFNMKAYVYSSEGYFYSMLQNANLTEYQESGTKNFTYDPEGITYPYPHFGYGWTASNNPFSFSSALQKDGENTTFSGFLKNPLDRSLWGAYEGYISAGNTSKTTYYSILATFKGLSEFNLSEDKGLTGLGGDGGWRPLDNDYREDTQVDSTTYKRKYTNAGLGTGLDSLNVLLDISFSKNTNNNNNPTYFYNDYNPAYTNVKTTRTNRWRVPTYEAGTYLPKRLSDEYTHNVSGISETSNTKIESDAANKAKSRAEAAAKATAIKQAKEAAEKAYPGRLVYSVKGGEENITTLSISGNFNKSWGVTTGYTAIASGTITIICETPSTEYVTYYKDAKDGGWYEYMVEPEYFSGILKDELRIFCGNSFTISVNDTFDDAYEITNVKVYYHYSENNYIAKESVESGIVDYNWTYYARFIPAGTTLTSGTTTISGMTYQDNDNGVGTQQWSGAGGPSVTLILAEYIFKDRGTDKYEYAEARAADYGKYIIVDKIEVKVEKKASSGN